MAEKPESVVAFKTNSMWLMLVAGLAGFVNITIAVLIGLCTWLINDIRAGSDKAFDEIKTLAAGQAKTELTLVGMAKDIGIATEQVNLIQTFVSKDFNTLKERVASLETKQALIINQIPGLSGAKN